MSFGRKKILLQINKIRDIYILTHGIIQPCSCQRHQASGLTFFYLNYPYIIYAPLMVILFSLKEKRIYVEKKGSITTPPLHCTSSRVLTSFVNSFPCDKKKSTEVVWSELGNKFQKERNPQHLTFANRLVKCHEPLISLDSCSEDYLTMVKQVLLQQIVNLNTTKAMGLGSDFFFFPTFFVCLLVFLWGALTLCSQWLSPSKLHHSFCSTLQGSHNHINELSVLIQK